MSKGEKRVREIVESECMWVLVLPSMPKGEIVGKHLTDSEWHEYRNNVQRIVGVFYRQHILVIDGKYSSDDRLRSIYVRWISFKFPKEQGPSDLNEDRKSAEEEDRSRALDPSAGSDHRWIATWSTRMSKIATCEMATQSQSLNQAWIRTVDVTPYRSFGDRDIKRNRKQGNKNAEIAICEMAIQSQPLNQAWIWTVDVTPYRSFGDRDIKRNRKQGNKNVEIAICEMAIQSQPLNQAKIWTVDLTPYRSFEDRVLDISKKQCNRNPDFAICEFTI
jgi:hypothetical protein